jgi:hypothetical protein
MVGLRWIGWCLAAWIGVTGCGPAVGHADDGATATSSGGANGEGGGGESPAGCGDATALIQPGPLGRPSGYEACDDGFVHRVFAVGCDPEGFAPGDCDAEFSESFPVECEGDADCGDGARCIDEPEPSIGCRCNDGCRSDTDCESDQSCYCDGNRSVCISADCRTDADCPADQWCGLMQIVSACGGANRRLACTTAADTCRVDAECDECLQCSSLAAEPWTCNGSTGICGPCG